MSFIHLHVHSHYSLLDGLPKIPELVAGAAEMGYPALALTDHGALYGAMEFYKAARRAGIKPIIGLEAYVAPSDMHSKNGHVDADYFHLILLAKNLKGYQNLLALVTLAHLDGYYYKPRIDKTILKSYSEGLIALSGCLRGEIGRSITGNNFKKAAEVAHEYQSIFGKGSFFLEIQRNSKKDETQNIVNSGLVSLSRETGIPLAATQDVHYLSKEDKDAQDILVCVGTGRTVEEQDRLDMRPFDLHLASAEEMAEKFADIPEALANTVKIAEQVELELPLGKLHFPDYPVPAGSNAADYFHDLCKKGLAERYGGETNIPTEAAKRLEYEMEIIKKKEYAAYFLVVADFVNWARKRGIICTTRGSAAGSLAAYALGITTMNPLEYKLPFERFLNPYRPTPPDIDMDFADNRRDEVLQYVSEKYGKDKVAQITTFGTMMARAAIRDVGRALGVAYSKCDRIAKMIPFGKQGFHMTISRALEIAPDLKEAFQKDPETHNLIDLARKVEGCVRHASVHAAGVVIAPTKLTDFTPLQMDTDNQHVITQYDMHSVEDAGLVKMDFLGIRNLSILGNAVEIVKTVREISVDLQNIPLDDKKTFELLSTGRTMGVFQLGGSGMTKYLVDLRPTNIFDIMAMISLYRPGPMESIPQFIERKHNPKLIAYLDPRLRDILDQSYGVITYQDDVLLIAINIAGYTWEEADKLRKAMGKKIPKEMAAQKEKFIQGAMDNGLSTENAVKLWALIEPFAAYGFNKAHAASYAIVAYQTAYMKANFPVEFMAAVLTAESGDNEKIAAAVAECRSLGIEVLPPDASESSDNFTVINNKQIRFGFSAIKNLGSDIVRVIIDERKANGQFTDLLDFVRRVKTRNFNKKSWEALVKSGSLDRFGERNQMLASTESVLDYARGIQKQAAAGQSMLLGDIGGANSPLVLKTTDPATETEKLSWEKELLGLYVSSHPLENHRPTLAKYCVPIKTLTIQQDQSRRTIGGILTRIQVILTKKGDQMCFADIEDLDGSLELVVFPSVFKDHRALLNVDQIVLVQGKISDKDGELKLLADKIVAIEQAEELKNEMESSDYPSTPSYPARHASPARQVVVSGGRVEAGGSPPSHWGETSFSPPPSAPISPPPFREGGDKEGIRLASNNLLKIKIPSRANPQIFEKLRQAFVKYPGETQVALVIPDREGTLREIKTSFTVSSTDQFKTELKDLLRESIKST